MIRRELKLISGNANRELTEEIASALGIDICDTAVDRFSDGEIRVRVRETVRGSDVYIIQPTSAPVNDHLMELLVLIDALRRASARKVISVIPYYGYSRQDRKHTGRVPITARLVANLLETAGADRVLTFDLHVGQIQGFFNIPCDNLCSHPVFADYFRKMFDNDNKTVIVAPDVGATKRARMVAEGLGLPLVILEKRRARESTDAEVVNVIGEVDNKRAILVDDIVSSGSTLIRGTEKLLEHGATEVHAYCTHGVFSGSAVKSIENSPLKKIAVTNTILHKEAKSSNKVDYISVGEHLAKTIRRIFENKSVSHLFPHH